MNWLLLDTACPEALVAIADDRRVIAQVYLSETLKHGERLSSAIASCLEQASLTMADLGGVAVGKGPGSFVGVRIAMAQAKGIGLARQIPVVGLCTLSAMAAAPDLPLGVGYVFVDARRGEFYVRHVERVLDHGELKVLSLSEPTTQSPEQMNFPPLAKGVGGFFQSSPTLKIIEMRGPSALGMFALLQEHLSSRQPGVELDEKFSLTPAYVRAPDAKISQQP